jgi:protein SCO1/2
MRRSHVINITAMLGLLCSVALLQSCGGEDSSLVGYVPPSEKRVSSVSATEVSQTETQQFEFVAPSDEVLLVYFGYTNCPDLCPTTLAAVRSAKRDIGDLADRVKLAMVTVDPERDTKDVLPAYLSSFSDQYHALIPASEDELTAIKDVFQASSSVTKNPDGTVEVGHSTTTYVVDDQGVVVVEWPYGLTAKDMANDLQILLK